jgi:hypothetical protein
MVRGATYGLAKDYVHGNLNMYIYKGGIRYVST